MMGDKRDVELGQKIPAAGLADVADPQRPPRVLVSFCLVSGSRTEDLDPAGSVVQRGSRLGATVKVHTD